MPQRIDVPGMGIVEFPDGMNDADITAAIQRSMPQQTSYMDTAKDVAKSAGTGLAQGALDVAGLPGSIVGLGDKAVDFMFNQTVGRLGNYLDKGTLAAPNETMNQKIEQMRKQSTLPVVPQFQDVASPEALKGDVESVTGKFYQPQTMAGQYAHTVGEFIPGSVLAPGNTAANAVRYGVLPALASETAGQVTKGTAAEPYARAGAAIATGTGAAMLSRPAYSERLVGNAASGVSDAQYAQAEQLMRDAQSRGIQLTPAEAIQQTTGGATRLGDVQRLAEAIPSSSERLAPMFSERPAQMRSATDAAFDAIAPRPADPSVQGLRAQQAADSAVRQTQANINSATSYPYQMMQADRIPAAQMSQLQADPIFSATLKEVRTSPALNRTVASLPDDTVGVVDLVQRRMREMADAARAPGQAHTSNLVAANYEAARTPALAATDAATAGGHSVVRDIQSQLRQQLLDPLTAGPVGAIQASPEIARQAKALLGKTAAPAEVKTAVSELMAQNPDATRAVVREGLGGMADKTVSGLDTMARPDQFGGAKLAVELRRNPRVSDNVAAAIEGVSNPAINDNVQKLVDALQATGWRAKPGSLTAFNQEALDEMKRGGVEGIAQLVTGPLKTARDYVRQHRLGSQADRLAEILMSGPDGVGRIKELSARGGDSANILARALLAYEASKGPNKQIGYSR